MYLRLAGAWRHYKDNEIMAIIEYQQLGGYMKVCAIDEETGIEAVSILPLGLTQQEMATAALQKLKYVMKKKDSGEGTNSGGFTI